LKKGNILSGIEKTYGDSSILIFLNPPLPSLCKREEVSSPPLKKGEVGRGSDFFSEFKLFY